MLPAATPARRVRPFSRLLPALLALLLLGGCGTSRVAYQFRPAPTAAAHRPAAPSDSVALLVAATRQQPIVEYIPTPIAPLRRAARIPQLHGLPVRRLVVSTATQSHTARSIQPAALLKQPAAKQAAVSPWHRTEVGLGTTVLGVLGLIVLPISLLGLLIWGGPVWAVLAGLAALAILVAYLDPFQ
ncbi:hypothetical protein [Hymenobacter daecheongensis]|uniref:hypothetical protein n=1 Tax=Hymenobacter daecheongensis TaxID=496053 RepID=UPI001160EE72|nr:hypothetical protein [Hymenobacter daecheongensis]